MPPAIRPIHERVINDTWRVRLNGIDYQFPPTAPQVGEILKCSATGNVLDWAVVEGGSHNQQHAITSTADHTSAATAGKVLKADSNGLPVAATNTDSEVASAVSLKHSNGLDHSNSLDHSNAADHAHSNKATLDTYAQTEVNLADAVTKKHANTLDHAQAHNVTTHGDMPANAAGYLKNNGAGAFSYDTPSGGSTPAWKGTIVAAWKDGDPHWVLDSLLHAPVHATPTNIAITVARCAFFKLDTAITVAKIRWFGVGAVTGLYHVAVYRVSDGARMAILDDFNTAAQAWGSGAFACTLAAGVLYLLAVSVDTIGTTAGVACQSGTTGRIGILPTAWPGSLDIDAASPKIDAMGFCQFAVTAGALPATLPTRVLQEAWTGGMPAFFMDSNNA